MSFDFSNASKDKQQKKAGRTRDSATDEADLLHLQRMAGNRAVGRMLRSRGLPPTQPKSTTGLKLQRKSINDIPSPEPAPEETAAPALIVDDEATTLAPGQMPKSQFLAELKAEVCRTADEGLARAGRSTEGCPYLDFWFNFYGQRDSQHIEQAIHKFVPETREITAAKDYIPPITARVRRSVDVWVETGEITGVPEGIPLNVPGAPPLEIDGTSATEGGIRLKAREGGPSAARSPLAIRMQLGAGRPLEGDVKSRMESAFGSSFSHVRVHADAKAAALSSRFNARAFTVGEHIALGSGEYQPGTPIGDALITHELAHVMQQRDASSSVSPVKMGDNNYNALEDDADLSAIGAVASLWGDNPEIFKDLIRNTAPRLRSGLKLQRCGLAARGGARIACGAAGKEAVKQGAKQGGKEAVKQAEKQAAKQVGKEAVKQAEKEAVKQAEKEAVKQGGKEATKEAEKEAVKQAEKQATKEAGKIVSGEQGKIIGWGTGQSAEAVKQTIQVTQNLTKEKVKEMISTGLSKEWVQQQLKMYSKAVAEQGVKLEKNNQLLARKDLMEKILSLWP